MASLKGFTLIEIIIVIVIIGVLATLSMPKITGQLETARAAEAMMMLGAIKRASDQCYDTTQSMLSCSSFAQIGVTAPTSTLFTYTSAATAPLLNVQAKRTVGTVDNFICMSVAGGSGATVFQTSPASSPYAAIIARTGASGTVANCGTIAGAMQ